MSWSNSRWSLLPAPALHWGPRGWCGWRGRSAGSRTSLERTAASRRAGRLRLPACSRAAPPLCPSSSASAPPAVRAPLLRPETLAHTAAAAPRRRNSPLLPATVGKDIPQITKVKPQFYYLKLHICWDFVSFHGKLSLTDALNKTFKHLEYVNHHLVELKRLFCNFLWTWLDLENQKEMFYLFYFVLLFLSFKVI